MAGAGDRGPNPSQGSHPRMGAGLPSGPGGGESRTERSGGGVGETLRDVASNVGEAAGQAREKVQEFVSGAAGRMGDAWEGARQGLRQGASAVASRAQDFWTDGQNLVRRYPMAALGVAFGLGWLACMAMRVSSWSAEDDMTRGMSRYSAR